uniref:Tc1-like transposase DDE domain-containing protein n=1 Tax=Oryzias melastigma TaxID=30732 RepID=A0A3B3DNT8_ORYME
MTHMRSVPLLYTEQCWNSGIVFVKQGGGNMMFWGCFGVGKVGDLFRVNKITILQHHAMPSRQHLIGAIFIQQQDDDPKHTSNLCENYLENSIWNEMVSTSKPH